MASSSTNRLPDAALRRGAPVAARAAPSRAPVRHCAQTLACCWGALSIGLFAGLWELCWASAGGSKLLPPPHIFLGNIADQAKFFNTANRWQIGAGAMRADARRWPCSITMLSSTVRVLSGL